MAGIYSGAPSGGPRAGATSATIDGEAVDVAADAAWDVTTVKREYLIGQSGPQDYSENPKAGMISFTARDANTMSVAAFMNQGPVTVVLHLANGKSISGDRMICTECSEVKTADGTFNLKYEGRHVAES